MKTLNKHEVALLVAFSFHVQQMAQTHGDEANIIKVEYDVESGDFDVVTNKQETGRRRRISKLIADVVSWANSQLDTLEIIQKLNVKKMACHFENDAFSIDLVVDNQITEEIVNTTSTT